MIKIGNTNRALLLKIRNLLGVGKIVKSGEPKERRKQGYELRIIGYKSCIGLIQKMLPHLIVKKKQAEIILQYYETRDRKLIRRTRELNKRGV